MGNTLTSQPDHIGPYEVLREIGRGGMGVVYLARDARLGREVAIKGLPEAVARDAERRARLEREARLLASLNHPNIATVHSLEEEAGDTYLVLEYVDGDTLARHLDRHGGSWQAVVEVGVRVADALAAAHEKGVIHRDIKPDNVRFTSNGVLKVLDFGLAVPARDAAGSDATFEPITTPGLALGTPGYMAPEQARGEAPDARSDLFALGCLLHELLSGRPTFLRDSVADSISATLTDDPTPLSADGTPAAVERLVMRCLDKDPARRPTSATEVAAGLRAPVAGSTSGAVLESSAHPDPASVPATAGQRSPRWPFLAVPIVALAALLWWISRSADPPRLLCLTLAYDEADEGLLPIAEELPASLSANLALCGGLEIVPRSLLARFGTDLDPVEVGRRLGASHVVTGTVRSHDGQLRVRFSLVDAGRETEMWGSGYKQSADDALTGTLDVDVARQILDALGIRATPQERERLARRSPDRARAYELYLRGRHEWRKRAPKTHWLAAEYFEAALALDPTYALAWSGKADCYTLLGLGLAASPEELIPKAREAAEKALRYDPDAAESQSSAALIDWLFEWDFEAAERAFDLALEINPRYATAHHFLAHLHASLGRYAEAVASSRRAHEVDPETLVYANCLGHHLVWDDRVGAGLRTLQETSDKRADFWLGKSYLGRMLVAYGSDDAERRRGLEILRRLYEDNPGFGDAGGDLGWAYARTGDDESARAMLADLRRRENGGDYIAHVAYARTYAGFGGRERQKTLASLWKALEAREAVMPLIAAEPHFRHLLTDPEFQRILAEIGLPHQ